MSYTDLGRCACSGVVYDIHPSFSVFNSNLYLSAKINTNKPIRTKKFDFIFGCGLGEGVEHYLQYTPHASVQRPTSR